MIGGNNTGARSGKKHEVFSRVTQPIHNHTREPHTTHTTPNIDMDSEIESIDNQSEEVAVTAAAAAASIMMLAWLNKRLRMKIALVYTERRRRRRRRRSPRQSGEGGPTRGLITWNRRGDSGYGSSKGCMLRKVGLTRIAERHGNSSLLLESPTRCSSASSRPWRLLFQLQHTTSLAASAFPWN